MRLKKISLLNKPTISFLNKLREENPNSTQNTERTKTSYFHAYEESPQSHPMFPLQVKVEKKNLSITRASLEKDEDINRILAHDFEHIYNDESR